MLIVAKFVIFVFCDFSR